MCGESRNNIFKMKNMKGNYTSDMIILSDA